MNEIVISVPGIDTHALAWELQRVATECGIDVEVRADDTHRGLDLPTAIGSVVVALGGTAGVKILYDMLRLFIERNNKSELRIERNGTKVTLKGHSAAHEQKLLSELLPSLKDDQGGAPTPRTRKSQTSATKGGRGRKK